MKASVKRIIWALGWFFLWTIDTFVSFYVGYEPHIVDSFAMLAIWIIPLFLFEDDKEVKKR